MDLPVEVQHMMEQGLLTAGHARAILAVPSEEGRIKLAKKVVTESLTVRQTENLAPLFSVEHTETRTKGCCLPATFKRAARELRKMLDHRTLRSNKFVARTRLKSSLRMRMSWPHFGSDPARQ